MWTGAWMAACMTATVWAQHQHTHTRVNQGGSTFEWGWQQQPAPGQHTGTVGHYYVKLPQSEQRVNYAADGTGYHSALAVNTSDGERVHTARFALGHRALQLSGQQSQHQHRQPNVTQLRPQPTFLPNTNPVEIFLLPQHLTSPAFLNEQLYQAYSTQDIQPVPSNYYSNPSPNQVHYDVRTQHVQNPQTDHVQNAQTQVQNSQKQHVQNALSQYLRNVQTNTNERKEGGFETVYEERDENRSVPLKKEDKNEQYKDYSNVIQVFKDHNCSADEESENNSETTKLFAAESNYETNANGNFDSIDKSTRPLTYRGAVHFRVENPRQNARSERYYHTTDSPVKSTNEDDRISRLVASTQDLISNEDLLKINHAAEKSVNANGDDVLKPRSRFGLRTEQTKYDYSSIPRSRITVKAKIGKIVDSEVEHIEHSDTKEAVLETNANEYKFASPIVVQDSQYENYKEQIVNNLVSTMVPYIENGYEIVGVRDSSNYTNFNTNNESNYEDLVNVTPRPIGQKYLAPITVALRLINDNDTLFNTIDDHEASDSEIVSETVVNPKETTSVEIQESIPVSITHINDVEVHEYMEDGRSNNKGPYDYAKALYNKYMEIVDADRRLKDFVRNKNYENSDNNNDNNDAKDTLEPSENVQTEVEVRPSDGNIENERREFVRDYYNYESGNQKVIQPIIIEKEVPITQFVDRYIEKQVPVPEPVHIQVPVDRPYPVAVPYEKIVEKPYEVTRYVDKPYPVEVPRPYPVEVKVPYPVEHKVYVDRPVHVPYPVEKVVEKQIVHQFPVPTPVAVPVEVPVETQILYPVPTPVAVPVEVEKQVPVEKIVTKHVHVPVPVEKKVPYPVHYETKVPVPYPVEKRVPYPVERVVEKPVTVTKIVEKPIHIEVPFPQPIHVPVHVPQPYPVDRIVEKRVPYPVPVDRVVEKKVPVQVPYPVEKIVEKIVEKPVIVTKYVDKPYPVEKRVPVHVDRIVEKRVPYPVQVPVEVKVPYPVDRNVEKPVQSPTKVPYSFEKPLNIYNYGYGQGASSQNYQQYQQYTAQDHKNGIPPPHVQNQLQNHQRQQLQAQYEQYYQNERDRQQKNQQIQTTHWGNLYASSYQHINNTPERTDFKKNHSLANYIQYLTNQNPSSYYGPPPVENYNELWERNKNYIVELKLRRTDRVPKTGNLRIEYGGFKPPLIPSTEVDLDGLPVHKTDQ